MIATNEETLAELFTDAIIGIVPRMTYKGAESWKPYEREVGNPTRTRRFRIVIRRPQLVSGGASAGYNFEHSAELRVRTDYVGDHSKVQFTVADDFMQLRDVLSGLKATDNGVMVVEAVDYRERDSFTLDDDILLVDHVFRCRYMRSIRP